MTTFIYNLSSLAESLSANKVDGKTAVIFGGDDLTASVIVTFCNGLKVAWRSANETETTDNENECYYFSLRAISTSERLLTALENIAEPSNRVTFYFSTITWNPGWFLMNFSHVLDFEDGKISIRKSNFLSCINNLFNEDPPRPFARIRNFLRKHHAFKYRRLPFLYKKENYEQLPPQRSKLFGRIISDPAYVLRHLVKIEAVTNALCDGKSRTQYRRLFSGNHRLHWESYFENFQDGPQYFDCLEFDQIRTVLNLGVLSGEEIPIFSEILGPGSKIINLDPSGPRFLTPDIAAYVAKRSDDISFVESFIGDGSDISYIQNENGGFNPAAPGAKPDGISKSITLNAALQKSGTTDVDLIKVDIEGAEEFIIDQIVEIACKTRCQIALSIYHKADHNWALPMKLIRALENYLFYYRCYSWAQYEGIFYCIPAEHRKRNPLAVRLVE